MAAIRMTPKDTRAYEAQLTNARACLAVAGVLALFTASVLAGAGFHFHQLMLFPVGAAAFAALVSLVYFWRADRVAARAYRAREERLAAKLLITRSDVWLSSVGLSNGAEKATPAVETRPRRPVFDNPTTGQLTSSITESEARVR